MKKNLKLIITSILLFSILIFIVSTAYNQIDAAIENTNVPEIHIVFQNLDGQKIESDSIKIEHNNKIINNQNTEMVDNSNTYTTTNGEIVLQASNSSSYNGQIRVLEGIKLKKGIIEFKYQFETNNNQPQNVVLSGIKNIDSENINVYYIGGSNPAYFYIKVDTTIDEPETEVIDGNTVRVDNLSEIGDAIEIIASKEAESKSISSTKAVQYLQNNGITVSQIKNIDGKTIDLSGEDLLGTGTTITTNNGEYKVVVYGDTTGDGTIDAADISDVINQFLGNGTQLSNISEVAGDVFKDDDLNAGDISLMINSFLGNLQGDILQDGNN